MNFAFSAIMERSLAEAPRGLYMPVSHSLMVCCRVPSCSDNPVCVRLRCRRRAWTLSPSHWFLVPGAFFPMPEFYTMPDKKVNRRK